MFMLMPALIREAAPAGGGMNINSITVNNINNNVNNNVNNKNNKTVNMNDDNNIIHMDTLMLVLIVPARPREIFILITTRI